VRGLDGRVAFVTGAGRGMGAAIARRLAEEGCRVAVTDIDKDAAAGVAAELADRGRPDGEGAHHAVHLDGTDAAGVAAAVEETAAGLGPIDVLVNNAGLDSLAPFLETDEDLWDRLIAINLKGVFHTCRAIAPQMAERRHGRIVNIGSDAGRVGSTGEAVYSATKGGIIAFSKTLAREVARHGITVNVVCPGPTDTPLLAEMVGAGNDRLITSLRRAIPLGRLGQPEEIAAAVAFLASDDASFVTGQTLSVSGGLTMS
jgi:2-hydroxycyclohexanecarboxyl-CoA dehydrogenase